MCGVVGVFTKNGTDAVELCASLLFRLQHRGQDGAGLVAFGGGDGTYQVIKGRGLIQDALQEWTTLKPSKSALAHTRYATTGTGGVVELQPFVSGFPKIAMAHNGNISNVHEVREKFQGTLQTESDLELLQEEFLKTYALQGFVPAVQHLMDTFEGGYAVVGILENGDLYAFRDPFGIRPLFLAESADVVAFASETGALDVLGNVKISEIQPGEWVIFRDGTLHRGMTVSAKNPSSQRRSCMFESVYFSSPQSTIQNVSVYRQRFQLGRYLAKQISAEWTKASFLNDEIDFVVPVPETSRVAATAVAEELGIPFREFLIKNPYVPRTFILSSQEKRLQALSQKLSLVGPELRDKRILLVDDSVVRGNTSRLMALRLREAGARAVYLASTCPPIVSGCYYGIDFPDKAELIADGREISEVATLLGVDGLFYLDLAGLKKALGTENLCTGCLTGTYPYSDVHHNRFVEERRKQRCL